MLETLHEVDQAARAELDAEGLRGDVFKVVRLIEDHVIVLGQHACVRVRCDAARDRLRRGRG